MQHVHKLPAKLATPPFSTVSAVAVWPFLSFFHFGSIWFIEHSFFRLALGTEVLAYQGMLSGVWNTLPQTLRAQKWLEEAILALQNMFDASWTDEC